MSTADNYVILISLVSTFFSVLKSGNKQRKDEEEEVDGTAAPDIFPHSHKFHVPFFITIIRNDEPSSKKQRPFTPS